MSNPPPPVVFEKAIVRCKVCDRGTLAPTHKHRMSGPVVFIGYILLIPSLLGVAFCILTFIMVASSARPGQEAATGIAGGLTVFMGIGAMVFGLLGWLLIMKKKVLECNVCQATVNAG